MLARIVKEKVLLFEPLILSVEIITTIKEARGEKSKYFINRMHFTYQKLPVCVSNLTQRNSAELPFRVNLALDMPICLWLSVQSRTIGLSARLGVAPRSFTLGGYFRLERFVMHIQLLLAAFVLLVVGACSDGSSDRPEDINPYVDYTSELYEDTQHWLCRPDVAGDNNVCAGNLSSTIVYADGATQLEEWPALGRRDVDCFYVYPTVSNDPTDNSDFEPAEEVFTSFTQAARYRSACELFVPVYRQITVTALLAGKFNDAEVSNKAYADVLDAFKHYVANAQGRGFVLIGHSQGSTHLIRLIQEEIENDAYLASRMIAAHLIGMTIAVPNEAEVGATFKSTLPCTFDDEIGCFVNYVTFRESNPPLEGAAFGVTDSENTRATCTHPVDLGAGQLILDSYFSASRQGAFSDEEANGTIDTPFIKLPGLVLGECIEHDGKGYLAVNVDADPADPRVDEVGVDFLPGWGLHLSDMPMAYGDLIRLADRQVGVWLGKQ